MTERSLHDYQKYAVTHILEHTRCGLFMDMGLGKTVVTLTAINELMYRELDIDSVLVIAPKRVADSVWTAERDLWEHLRHLQISKIMGTQQQRIGALNAPADIYIIGRDNVAWLCGLYDGTGLPFDMLVVDELSSFKNPKAVRFKALRKTQPGFKRIVGLTGTPAPNGLIDLWSQMWLLDRGDRLGRTLTDFRSRYFVPGKRNGHIVYEYKLRKESEDKIHQSIKDICVSMKAQDYLKLKGSKNNTIRLEFPEKIRRQYEAFEEEQVLRLFSDVETEQDISAVNAAALSNKLLQFANGAVYDENRDVHEVHKIKLEALEEIVELANGQPVLVAWAYKHDRDRILACLKKYNPRQLTNNEDIQAWNRGEIPVLLMHPASGGHGLNLQAGGNILVWFGQNWSLELYQQLNKRLDRQGQREQVIIHHLVMSGTIDEEVIHALALKTARQDGLLEAVKAKIRKYLKKNL